jgi:hypothetical protein
MPLDCSSLHGTCSWKKGIKCNAILQSQCTLPCPKEISLKIKKNGGEDIEILDVEVRRPYVMSFGSYVVQEAVLDEEYWVMDLICSISPTILFNWNFGNMRIYNLVHNVVHTIW